MSLVNAEDVSNALKNLADAFTDFFRGLGNGLLDSIGNS